MINTLLNMHEPFIWLRLHIKMFIRATDEWKNKNEFNWVYWSILSEILWLIWFEEKKTGERILISRMNYLNFMLIAAII